MSYPSKRIFSSAFRTSRRESLVPRNEELYVINWNCPDGTCEIPGTSTFVNHAGLDAEVDLFKFCKESKRHQIGYLLPKQNSTLS